MRQTGGPSTGTPDRPDPPLIITVTFSTRPTLSPFVVLGLRCQTLRKQRRHHIERLIGLAQLDWKWTVLPVRRRCSPTALRSAQPRTDEVLQVVFNEIDHPSSFVLVCRRFNSFARAPYVRAHYFLSRYGPVYALYWALGRGPLITEQVLDVSALIHRFHSLYAGSIVGFRSC
jgi:hypothetical protein